MEFSSKKHQTAKTKQYIKTTKLFFFFAGIDRDSNNRILVEQSLSNLKFNYYKIFNKTTSQILQDSTYNSAKSVISGVTFLIKPASTPNRLSKQTLISNLESLLFMVSAVKLNNKIYSAKKLKSFSSMEYKENKLLLCQFSLANLKSYFKI